MNKQASLALPSFFTLLLLLSACAPAASEPPPLDPAIRSIEGGPGGTLGRTIVAQGDYAYAPFEYTDAAGEPAGFNIDLLKRVAEIMALDLRIELGPWELVRERLERGEIDMLAGMYRTPERDALVDFSVPQFISYYAFYATKAPGFVDIEELRNYTIAVQTGDLGHDFLLQAGFGGDKLVEFSRWDDIFEALRTGKADYALASMVQASRLIAAKEYRELRRVGPPILQEKYCMAVREGDSALLAVLNEGLSILKATGEYDRIYEKWFGLEHIAARGHLKALRILAAALGVALALSALVLAWSAALRTKVRAKTAELSLELAAREETQARLEQALGEAERLRSLAEEADRSKSVFLASISHELRTPLHGIIGLGRLLERSELTEDQASLLCMLQGASGQLERLITDLLDLTKAATGKLSLAPETFALGKLAEWTEASLRQEAGERGLKLVFTISEPELNILADRTRLIQIILNLAGNGIKHTERGEVSVRVSYQGGNLEILAADTGPGIREADLERIFQTFYQADSAPLGPAAGGLGLGLSIVKSVVELMEGTVTVENRPSGGSLFTVRIPLASQEPPAAGIGDADRALPAAEYSGRSVLIAEDEGINALYLKRILEERGIAVLHVQDGGAAVRLRRERNPDLVLMDMGLPVMNGLEAARSIRSFEAESKAARVPIVALTANAYQQDREACREAGMDGFLAKPFIESVLWAEIGRVLGR